MVRWRLCLGCGVCTEACRNGAIELVNVTADGIRPRVDAAKCAKCGDCVKVCPGIEITHERVWDGTIPELRLSWGPVLELWEGHSTDPEVRFAGSSGGVVTALALFALSADVAGAVLHTGSNADVPLENIAVVSKCRADLLRNAGSRYSPAALCAGLGQIGDASGRFLLVGKPCDIAAFQKYGVFNRRLQERVGLVISIFCAGTPSTKGTLCILDRLGVSHDKVRQLRYRGYGWPGSTTVMTNDPGQGIRQLSYEESWGGILSKHIQFRCRLCPDSTGEMADVSCGDPWYRSPEQGESGSSLIVVRTPKGREFLHRAIAENYVEARRLEPGALPDSQKALLRRRRELFGRLVALRTMRLPAPCFTGFSLFANWRKLPIINRCRSVLGMARRIIQRGWYRPQSLFDVRADSSANPRTSAGRAG